MLKRDLSSILLIIALLTLLFGCASSTKTISNQAKMSLLDQEIQNWREFRISGISELETQMLSFRNPCVILRAEDKFRFDVLNSGLLGLGRGVFLQFYAEKKFIQYREPLSPDIKVVPMQNEPLHWMKFLSTTMYDELETQKDYIIETHKAHIGDFDLKFSNTMRLAQITSIDYDIRINFYYDRHDRLYEIRATIPMIRNLTIHVDKIEYSNVVINPLR